MSLAAAQILLFLSAAVMVVAQPRASHEKPVTPLVAPLVLAAWIVLQRFTFMRAPSFAGDLYAFRVQALCLFACFTAFYLTATLSREPRCRRHIVFAMVALALLEALYGLAQHLLNWPYILAHKNPSFIGDATGTYINHDHFAGLLEMLLPFCASLTLMCGARAARARRGFLSLLGEASTQKSVMLGLGCVLTFVAIAFSQSRMGLVAISSALVAMITVLGTRRSGARAALPALVLLIASGIATVWIGAAPIITHFESLPQEAALSGGLGSRAAIWRDACVLLREHPLTGIGLGSFPYAFPRVQDTFVNLTVLHAHNDYLEYAIELGIPAAALLIGMIVFLALQTLRVCRCGPRDIASATALGAFGGIIALLVHSFADFNLHIPANALVFSVVLGLGYGAAHSRDSQATPSHEKQRDTVVREAWCRDSEGQKNSSCLPTSPQPDLPDRPSTRR